MNEEFTRVTLKGGAVIDTAMTTDEVLRIYREALSAQAPEGQEPDQTMTLVTEEKHDEFVVRTETSFNANLFSGIAVVTPTRPVAAADPDRPKRKYTRRQPAEASQNGKRTMNKETRERMSEARKQYWADVKAGRREGPKRKSAAAA